ncbi:hypothetical protein CBR_g34088 [Chara braunii]|uniref:Reverse transcriptase n=1 Tax=Chara braunii TaxID=69332 RepID=A0A388LI34_CHABU|nr:hypothetical protein CBR_g34088 [Chara braunii]|eukprot:GBG81905.1 hypothetical protein CBR_g34088 [Chara braunii]
MDDYPMYGLLVGFSLWGTLWRFMFPLGFWNTFACRVETKGGTTTHPYTPEEEAKATAILKERREEAAKKKALLEEQVAKLKKMEEEMAREKERLKKEEEAKLKEVEEEEEDDQPLERRRWQRGQASEVKQDEMKKKISEWVANLSLGEEEEVAMYIPKDEQEAAVKAWDAEEDPLKRQAMEDETRMEWRLRMMREKKKRMEAASAAAKGLEEVKSLREQLAAQTDLQRKVEVIAQNVERLAQIQGEQYEFSRSQDMAVRSMRMGFRDFARELVGAVGAEVNHRLEKTERFCVGAIEGVKLTAPKEEEARPRREPVKVKFLDSYSGKREENFDNWEANVKTVKASDRLQKGVMDEWVAVLDHGVTETQLVNLFYRAMPESLRGHFFAKSRDPATTYDALSREVVAFEAKSASVSTFWHKDLDKVSIDFMDASIKSRHGKSQVMVIVDRFSKYAVFVPLPSEARTKLVIRKFFDQWVSEHGVPLSIVSDRDTRFTSQNWQELMRVYGSKLLMSSGRHPETNGQTEQMNKIMQQVPRMYIRPDQIDWDEMLPKVASAYNNSVHLSTCRTPNELYKSFRPRRPFEGLNQDQIHRLPPGAREFALQHEKELATVVENLKKAQHRMIEQANKHCRPSQFQVGDLVWFKAKEFAPEENISQKAAPEKFYVALYSAGHKDRRSFGRAALDMEAKLHVQAPSSDRRKGAFPRGGRKGKAAFAYTGSGSASEIGSQPVAESSQPKDRLADPQVELPNSKGVYQPCMIAADHHPKTSCFCLRAREFYALSRQYDHERLFIALVKQTDAPTPPCPPEIQQVVDQYADLMQEPFGLPNRPTKHHIELLPGAVPPKGRIYRMSPAELEELRRQLETLTSKGWIRPNTSEFGAPVLFVPKGSGEFRMCIDYRGLNKITRKSTEPLPRIDDLLDMVQGCTIFSKVDLKSGYHQIEMAEEDVHKTAFKTRYGTYEYLVMPFGLCNAPGTFQTEMHRIFRPYLDKFMVVYLDDILVFSKTTKEHAEHLALVLQSLRDSQYKINKEKSSFGVPSVIYLGHMAFARLKQALTRAPVLKLPDPTLTFVLTTDASQYGIGAVLQQDDGNGLRPVEFMSKKIKTQELQDSTYEKELYALVSALKHWKHFLLGRHFKIFSDHSTLQWLKSQGELNDKLARYIQFIDLFDFELEHKKGGYNKDMPRQEVTTKVASPTVVSLSSNPGSASAEHFAGKHLGPIGVLAALTGAEVVTLPSPLHVLAKASGPHIAPQTHSDPPTLCSRDVSESLEELQSEWSGKDPRDSWAMISRGPKGEHFVVEVDVGGRKVGAFVDTGSTRSFISRACVDRLRLGDQVQRLSRTVASAPANKHQMLVKDHVKDVVCTFSYGGGEVRHKISFLVSDELPFDMLLGMYYLEVAQPQFDWDRKVLIHKLSNGRTVRLQKYKASSLVENYGYMCASSCFNYYKQNCEEGMYLVFVSTKGEAVKTPLEIESIVAQYSDPFEEPTGVVEREVVHVIEVVPGSKMAALVKEKRKELLKRTKLKAIAEEQAAKMKKLEEEMEEKKKVVEEEAAAEEAEERRHREAKGESSGTKNEDAEMEKKISEWIANLSLGEDEEAQLYVPQEEKEAFARALATIEDPLERQETEEEKKFEWKLRMKREKKRRREEVNWLTAEAEKEEEARKKEKLELKREEAEAAEKRHVDYIKALQESFASYTAEMAKVWGSNTSAKIAQDPEEIQMLKAKLASMKNAPSSSNASGEMQTKIEELTRKINDLTAELAKVAGEKKRPNGVVIMSSPPNETAKGKQKIDTGSSINEDRWRREIEMMRKDIQAREEREKERDREIKEMKEVILRLSTAHMPAPTEPKVVQTNPKPPVDPQSLFLQTPSHHSAPPIP